MNTLSHIPSIQRRPFSLNLVTVAVSSFLVFGRHWVQILAKTPNSQYEFHRGISQSVQQIEELTPQSRHSFFYILSKSSCISHPNVLNSFMEKKALSSS
jgi:hypothetical protein